MNITPLDDATTGTVYCTGEDGCYCPIRPDFWDEHLAWHESLVRKITNGQLEAMRRAGKS